MALELTTDFIEEMITKTNEEIYAQASKFFKEHGFNSEDSLAKYQKTFESKVFKNFKYVVIFSLLKFNNDKNALVDLLIDFKFGLEGESEYKFEQHRICGQILKENIANLSIFLNGQVSVIEKSISDIEYSIRRINSIGEINHK